MKAALLGLMLAVVVVGATPAGHADGIAATVARIKPAIVGIGTYQSTRRPPAALMGTGFVIGDGRHALTNFHVVNQALEAKPPETLMVFVGRGEQGELREARIVAADAAHDVAVLAFDGAPLPALDFGDDAAVAEGDEIAFTGFPIGAVLGLYPATHRGIVAAWTPIAIPAIDPQQLDVAMIKRLRDGEFFVFQLDATAFPGNSGSPLYLADSGAVIGIVSSVFVQESKENILSNPSGISYAIPIRYARDLMREAGVAE